MEKRLAVEVSIRVCPGIDQLTDDILSSDVLLGRDKGRAEANADMED